MDFKTLLRKHQALLAENKALKEENLSLKTRLGLAAPSESRSSEEGGEQDASRLVRQHQSSQLRECARKHHAAGKLKYRPGIDKDLG
jgi:hypothetical protein